MGKHVAVIEKRRVVGGVCVNTGTIPSKTFREAVLHLSGFRERGIYGSSYTVKQEIKIEDLLFRVEQVIRSEIDVIRTQLARNRVQLIEAEASFIDAHHIRLDDGSQEDHVIHADKVVIACGTNATRDSHITFDGQRIDKLSPDTRARAGIGYVPQGRDIFPHLTIEENLQMGMFQDSKRFAERLEFVTGIFAELGTRLKQRAGSLSGGERQMVAMSRALMMDPAVLLLDEPSAGLSPVRQDEAFIRVSEINKAGVTTIMVEQNARRCLQICDRGYVLDQGTDAYTGTGRDLLNDPKVIGLYLGTLGA
jgi:branched-chain amino acid transport system ATP-binding protein